MLKLGIFMMPIHPANKNLVDCLEEDRNLVIKADKLNYSEAWMGEHYSSSGVNQCHHHLYLMQV